MKKLLLGLIGGGIQRSLSPFVHEEEGKHHGLRVHYQLIDLDAAGVGNEALPGLIGAARVMGFAGLNVTFPCKQAVIPLLDELSAEARAIGAVNTVVRDGARLIGYNTDGSGWSWGFRRATGPPSSRPSSTPQPRLPAPCPDRLSSYLALTSAPGTRAIVARPVPPERPRRQRWH